MATEPIQYTVFKAIRSTKGLRDSEKDILIALYKRIISVGPIMSISAITADLQYNHATVVRCLAIAKEKGFINYESCGWKNPFSKFSFTDKLHPRINEVFDESYRH